MPDKVQQELRETIRQIRALVEDQQRLGLSEYRWRETPVPAGSGSPAPGDTGPASPDVSSVRTTLEDIARDVVACDRCPLGARRKRLTGVGPASAELVVAVPAPSRTDLDHGALLSGEAGRMFEAILFACGLHRSRVYVTSLIKCSLPDRPLTPTEVQPCLNHFQEELRLLPPVPVLVLGVDAATWLWPQGQDNPREDQRTWENHPVRVTHHPAELLKHPEMKPELWEDLKGLF